MKKKITSLCSIFFALILSVFVLGFTTKTSYAETTDEDDDIPVVSESTELTLAEHFIDEDLYNDLKVISQQIKRLSGREVDNKLIAGDFAQVKVLNLTKDRTSVTFAGPSGDVTIDFFDNTSEDLVTNIRGEYTELDGIEYLRGCTNLTTLIVDGHKLSTIESYMLLEFPNLAKVSAQDNVLTSVTFPTSSKICEVNLAGNKLESVDLSYLTKKSAGFPYAVAHLENNLFTDVANITMPNSALTEFYVYLSNNYLTDVTAANITTYNDMFAGHNVSMLVQGIKQKANTIRFTNNTYIRVNQDSVADGFETEHKLTAKAFYRVGSDFAVDGVETLASESGADGKLVLPTGRLVIRYYNNGVEYTDTFAAQNVDVYPDMPTMKVEIDGAIQEENPQTVKGTFKVIAMAPEGAKVEIRFANTSYVTGNYITIEESGEYIVYAQVTIDGLTSEEAYLFIKNTSTVRMTWGLIIIVGAAVLIIGGVYLYKWFKSGALVTPLSDREIAREQIRRDRQARKNEEKRK